MGSSQAKPSSATDTITTMEVSSGFHLIELHLPTIGMGFTFLIVILLCLCCIPMGKKLHQFWMTISQLPTNSPTNYPTALYQPHREEVHVDIPQILRPTTSTQKHQDSKTHHLLDSNLNTYDIIYYLLYQYIIHCLLYQYILHCLLYHSFLRFSLKILVGRCTVLYSICHLIC